MVDETQAFLREPQDSIIKRFAEAKEAYLLQVFGSYENAKQIAHLYTFEEDDFQFTDEGDVVKVEYNFRVRPKTPEEIARDEAIQHQATEPDEDPHYWVWNEFNFAGWIECGGCGYRPHNQEDMDEHIPPAEVSVATED